MDCPHAEGADIPSPLLAQLATGGRAIAAPFENGRQILTLPTKCPDGLRRKALCEALYVTLRGAP